VVNVPVAHVGGAGAVTRLGATSAARPVTPIAPHSSVEPAAPRRDDGATVPARAWLLGVVVGALAVAVATAALLPFRSGISRATPALVFVLPVVVAGIVGRRTAAVVTALGSAFVFSFAFVPPYDRVSIAQSEDVAALVVFVLVALVVGTLMAVEADRRQAAEQRADEMRRLLERNNELEVERERLREEAARVALMERVDEQRSALLRSVSHDLRTPLATIQAVTSDLRDGTEYPPDTRRRLLDLVGDEASRLNRIVANLLSLSRIEAGSFEPDRQAVAIDELVAERVRNLERLFERRTVEVDLGPGLPLVDADYSQLDQVITNLLENAARHTPPGSTIRVDAVVAGPFLEVSVSDGGDGVAPDELAHIFEPFRRGRDSASSGVGLAICKAIVEAHGGIIGVDSTESGGARFHLTIPVHG
jgi:K+-sensing histidine kinase KdpD